MKYRIVKDTYANGETLWRIQSKFLFWWVVEDSGYPYFTPIVYRSEEEARAGLKFLLSCRHSTKIVSRKVIE